MWNSQIIYDITNNSLRESAILKKMFYRLRVRFAETAPVWPRPAFLDQIVEGIDFILEVEPAEAYDLERYLEFPNPLLRASASVTMP